MADQAVVVPHILHFDAPTREALLALEAAINKMAASGGNGGGPGVTDHGDLTGLADDDHAQYLLPTEIVAGANVTVSAPGDGTVHIASAAGGVTDHGVLTGLADDDHPQYTTDAEATTIATSALAGHTAAGDPHPQYLTPTEGDAAYDALGAASSGDAAHVAAADPHAAYLKPAELLRGEGIDVDATTTPGSVIVKNRYDVDEWFWVAASTVTPAVQQMGVNAADFHTATTMTVSRTSANNRDPNWLAWLTTGDNIIVSVPGTIRRMRYEVTGHSGTNATVGVIPVLAVEGTEPNDGERVTLQVHYASGAGTGITITDADNRYVNVNGDTMTGALIVSGARIETNGPLYVKDPVAGTGGWATQRLYHDGNTNYIALDVVPTATPGLEVSDNRGGGGANALLRLAYGERAQFPNLGHQHRCQARGPMAGNTPVTSWTQMTLGAATIAVGPITWQSNGIYLYEPGFYVVTAMSQVDRALVSFSMSLKFAGGNLIVFGAGQDAVNRYASRFGATTVFYASAAGWFTVECQTDTPCWAGVGESHVTLCSLF